MNVNELDTRINNFLRRKYTTHPELASSGRNRARTTKYAMKLRATGQILLARVS